MKKEEIKTILAQETVSGKIRVCGWVRTRRGNKQVSFVALNDGSTINSLQIVFDLEKFSEEELKEISTGACICVTGTLVESLGKGQDREVQAEAVEVYGAADPESYPLQKKGHSLDFLREIAHLRPRTNTFGAVLRVRHTLSYGIHKFFHDKGFFYINTPIITGSDAEGAGEMFRVSVLDPANPPKDEAGQVDYSRDFFGKETNLTVSGQLEAETAALALSKVYTFGPTFRAENSNTTRHLAEFWMVEPEVAFNDADDNADLAEEMLKYLTEFVLNERYDDLVFLDKMYEEGLIEKLKHVCREKFERITYSAAVEILEQSGKKFEFKPEQGKDLQSEHERYLTEEHFKKPVIVTDYPKGIKAFYMRQNDDGATVRAMDVLFPGIGEIIGGSQREERYDKLAERVREAGLPEKELWWYLETRKFGTAPHSGFGLGLERLVQFVTGMSNIRDVIPFPRTPKNAEF